MKKLLIVFGVISIIACSTIANALTGFIDPIGDVGTPEWTTILPSAPGTHYFIINRGIRDPNAGHTSNYIRSTSTSNSTKTDTFTMTSITVDDISNITVNIYGTGDSGVGNYIKAHIYMGGEWTTSTDIGTTGTVGWHSASFDGDWTQADLDAIQIAVAGLRVTSTGPVFHNMYATVTYDLDDVNTITTSGAYTVYTFLTSGTFTPPATIELVDVLTVAGGGGGGYNGGGGGGAGGVIVTTDHPVTEQAYPVVVGVGGNTNDKGDNTTFDTITAEGGGTGGSYDNDGLTGGSGGGAANNGTSKTGGVASTTPAGQGYAGGDVTSVGTNGASGGGGASEVGANLVTTQAGAGGDGLSNSYSGSAVVYGGGGGGGAYDPSGSSAGAGGSGGGGAGGLGVAGATNVTGVAGTVNTGGGGGGGGGNAGLGGTAGSGIVIIRYLTPEGGEEENTDDKWILIIK